MQKLRGNAEVMTQSAVICAVVIMMAICAGCGQTDGQKASGAARKFVAAMQDGDRPGAEKTLTNTARDRMGVMQDAFPKKTVDSRGYRIGEVTVNGDIATVRVTLDSKEGSDPAKILLKRQAGEWRVYGISQPSPTGGPDLTMDFERPELVITDAFREMGRVTGMFAAGMATAAEGFTKGFQEGVARANAHKGQTGMASSSPIIETTPGSVTK